MVVERPSAILFVQIYIQLFLSMSNCTDAKRVPIIGTFLTFWVPIGSLFIFQGPYFQCFGFIHAKNVNLVCMNTTISYLDLSVMSNDLH